MASFRRLLTYAVCVAVAAPPFAYGQNAPATKATPAQPPALTGVNLSASQHQTYARLMITWPQGMQGEATAAIGSGLALIRLPRPLDVDPAAFSRGAPGFVGGAALSADKRTIRLGLVQGARIISSRDGDTQAFDLVLTDAPNPPAFSLAAQQAAAAEQARRTAANAPARSGPPKEMVNSPAPVGAPRVLVETAVSKDFTRIRLTNTGPGGTLPAHGFARTGDRLAIAVPGQYALDVAAMRAQPPARVRDTARYSSPTDTALVLDVEAGAVVRHSRDGNSIILDILPPGSDPNAVNGLIAQAAANVGTTTPTTAPTQTPAPAPTAPGATPTDTKTALASAEEPAVRPDPAPSGRVEVTMASQNGNVVLEFSFATPAPAVVFRRGDSIYALFATKATFDTSKVKTSASISSISSASGEGVSGVRIVAPPQVIANPSALGGTWRVALAPAKAQSGRTIAIDREQVADGTSRVKAIVPDAAATGSFVDPVVGDTILLGLALGPASPMAAPRAFIEASLPETAHGLVVTPRTAVFDLRRSMDGFVLVRPQGMALSNAPTVTPSEGFAVTSPGFIDHKNWRLGPQTDFVKNLDRMRREASQESGNGAEGVQKRLDLARFYLAWGLGAEAAGVLVQLKGAVPAMERAPEFVALLGIAQNTMGRGKEALETLSQPEVASDAASQLWAGLAAQDEGNNEEAVLRFARGTNALDKFWPEQRALFLLANAKAALELGDYDQAGNLAARARSDAAELVTKQKAGLILALAQGKAGKIDAALAALTQLEGASDREVAARAKYAKAILGFETGKLDLPDTIRALDSLRYAWRGDDLEIDVLRRLGGLYIQGGDIRSGLTTMTSATSLRTDLPAARLLRDDLFRQFKYLFLEGGADGMPPVQALALFYDFKDLAPIGPEGDRMVRGLADRLVALDLLPQATQLLQHQVDKRLEGFAKAQVATDLAAIYLMDRRPEPALKAIWNSRVTMLPEALNAQRRLIEAAALAELGRTDHAIEIIEFDNSPDASRLRAELYMRAGDWTKAAANARATLPAAKASFEPEEAGEVLRTAIASTMAGEQDAVRTLVENYGPVMGKSAYAEAFNVVTNPSVPEPAALEKAMASVTGGSPYNGLMKRLRHRLSEMPVPAGETAEAPPPMAMQVPDGPTDGDPQGFRRPVAPLVPDVQPTLDPNAPVATGTPVASTSVSGDPAQAATVGLPAPEPKRAPKAVPSVSRPQAARSAPPKAVAKAAPRPATPRAPTRSIAQSAPRMAPTRSVQAPRDPPPAPIAAR